MVDRCKTKSAIVAIGLIKLVLMVLFEDFINEKIATLPELSTPANSFKRLKEGIFLTRLGISPYEGSACHHSPLLLMLFSIFEKYGKILVNFVFVAAEMLTAYGLSQINHLKKERTKAVTVTQTDTDKSIGMKSQNGISDTAIAIFYMCNPYMVGVAIAKSSNVFEYMGIVLAIYSAMRGKTVQAGIWISIATFVSVYPVLLVYPIMLIIAKEFRPNKYMVKGLLTVVGCVGVFHILSTMVYGKEYLDATVGFVLGVEDLQPTVGLYWYFFIEMFTEFEKFYKGVFHMNVVVFVIPTIYKFRKDAVFASMGLVGIIGLLRAYPTLGEMGLLLTIALIYEELLKYLSYAILGAGLVVSGTVLAPSFWSLWIYKGTGNANFYFAASLVYSIGYLFLLIDFLTAKVRKDIDDERPDLREKKISQR